MHNLTATLAEGFRGRAPEGVPAIAFARVQRYCEQPAKAFCAAEIKRDEHTFARRVLCLRAQCERVIGGGRVGCGFRHAPGRV